MEFKVKFIGNTRYSVSFDSKEVGLNLIDLARQQTGVSDLYLQAFPSCTGENRKDPTITITEEVARESNLFSDKNSISVINADCFLNDCCELVAMTTLEPLTGAVIEVCFKWILDESKAIEKWKSLGYPLSIEATQNELNY